MNEQHLTEIKYLDFSDLKIAVIGDCMLDIYHYGIVDRISPEAPVPIFKANNSEPEYRLGGAANTALNLAKLGVKTSLFGFIGKDINATYIKQYLLENNINVNLFELKGFPTITKNRYFSKNQQIIRIDQEDTDYKLYVEELQNELTDNILSTMVTYDAFILSDYGKGALSPFVLNSILTYCHEDLPIFVDPKRNNWGLYKNAFMITPNWTEFSNVVSYIPQLTSNNIDQVKNAAIDLCLKHNLDNILITLGSSGMVMISKDSGVIAQAARAEEVYDVSGAGDTVIATIAAAYCKEYPLSICMQLATMAAKVVISKLGTYAITDSDLRVELMSYINGRG